MFLLIELLTIPILLLVLRSLLRQELVISKTPADFLKARKSLLGKLLNIN